MSLSSSSETSTDVLDDDLIVEIANSLTDDEFNVNRVTLREVNVNGFGTFHCANCNKRWTSRKAGFKIDCRAQCFVVIYQQKCQRCNEDCIPAFTKTDFVEMIEWALIRSNQRRDRNRTQRPQVELKQTHDSTRCEQCNYGPKCTH